MGGCLNESGEYRARPGEAGVGVATRGVEVVASSAL